MTKSTGKSTKCLDVGTVKHVYSSEHVKLFVSNDQGHYVRVSLYYLVVFCAVAHVACLDVYIRV